MRLSDFDYELPPERIAQTPIEPRDAARLLVDRGDAPPEHRHVRDLVELLPPGDLLVLNETKVIPARLALRRATGGAAEVLMLEPLDGERRVWEALVRPARKLKPGETLFAADGTPVVEIGRRTDAGDTFTVTLVGSVDSLRRARRARRDAAAALHHRAPARSRPLPDDLRPRAGERGSTDRRSALHPGAARRARRGRASRSPRSNSWSGSTRSVRSPPTTRSQHRMHTERYRVPDDDDASAVATPSASSPSARPRCGRSSRRPPAASSRAAPTSSSTAATTGRWSTC